MKLFEKMLSLPGAVAALTRVLGNHVITDVALGTVTDETKAQAQLYNALFVETNDDHCTIADTYETMFDGAPKGDKIMSRMRVSEEQWAAFGGKPTVLGIRELKASFAGVTDLRLNGGSDINAWKKLSEHTQHKIAVAVERSLVSAADRYGKWVADRPTVDNMRKAADADKALALVPLAITEYIADPKVSKAIEEAIASGKKATIREQVAT